MAFFNGLSFSKRSSSLALPPEERLAFGLGRFFGVGSACELGASPISLVVVTAADRAAATCGAADGYSRVVTSKHRCSMDAADKPTSAAGRKALNDPRIHRYYVRLTSEQNERFLRMYEHSGMKNRADFICHRIFG